MSSILSYSGLQFDDFENKYILVKMANDNSLEKEERLLAVCIALYFDTIGFSKAEEILRELGMDVDKAFEGYMKRLKELESSK